jgi:hypothetical protein
MTFAQIEGTCFCCGKTGHKSTECKQRLKIALADWAINKTTATALNLHQKLTIKAQAAASTPAVEPPPVVAAMTTSTTGFALQA